MKWNHEETKWNHETNFDTRFIDPFYVKKRVSLETLFFFIFILDQFHVKLYETCDIGSRFFWHPKRKLADGFIILRGIKLWNRQRSVGKQNETDGRGIGKKLVKISKKISIIDLVLFSDALPA